MRILVSYTQQWHSNYSVKTKHNGERCLQIHQNHINVKDHKDNDDNNNFNTDENDVNDDKNDIVIHIVILLGGT